MNVTNVILFIVCFIIGYFTMWVIRKSLQKQESIIVHNKCFPNEPINKEFIVCSEFEPGETIEETPSLSEPNNNE